MFIFSVFIRIITFWVHLVRYVCSIYDKNANQKSTVKQNESKQNKNNKYSQYNTINTNVLIIDHVKIVSRMGDMVYSSCSPSDGAVYLSP
jgi:hypothetical protein